MRWKPAYSLHTHEMKTLMTDEEIKIYQYVIGKRKKNKDPSVAPDPFWMRYMLRRDGITIWDVGQGREDYCLGRYGDTGDYTVESARFITVLENQQERKSYNGEWTPERRQRAAERAREQRVWETHDHEQRTRDRAGHFTKRERSVNGN